MKQLLLLFSLAFPIAALAEPLYPLEVGMYWVYEMEHGKAEPVTNQISEQKTILGKEWYRLVEYGDSYWVRNTADGQVEAINLWNTDAKDVDTIDEVLIFKFPASAGDRYEIDEDSATVTGEKTVTVPAGTFSCIEYRLEMGSDSYSISCIAKGVGVVHNEFLNEGQLSISRLQEYGRR